MRKIVIDMQNYLFADAVATAFKNSDSDIEVIRAESPRDTVELCPECKIALMVDSNTERQAAKDIRDAKKDGLIDQFFYGSMSAEYLMDQIYAM